MSAAISSDGTIHVFFELMGFIARLAVLIPKPRVNLIRYHGVFAPNSAHRAAVTPASRGRQPVDIECTLEALRPVYYYLPFATLSSVSDMIFPRSSLSITFLFSAPYPSASI